MGQDAPAQVDLHAETLSRIRAGRNRRRVWRVVLSGPDDSLDTCGSSSSGGHVVDRRRGN